MIRCAWPMDNLILLKFTILFFFLFLFSWQPIIFMINGNNLDFFQSILRRFVIILMKKKNNKYLKFENFSSLCRLASINRSLLHFENNLLAQSFFPLCDIIGWTIKSAFIFFPFGWIINNIDSWDQKWQLDIYTKLPDKLKWLFVKQTTTNLMNIKILTEKQKKNHQQTEIEKNS